MYETQDEIDTFCKALFHYRHVKKLGEGAFGIALLVFDEVENISKVIKLPKNAETTEALRHEGTNMRKLQELLHPNIIRLYQYGMVRMTWRGIEEERFYLNMAYGGSSLRAKMGDLRREQDQYGNNFYFGSGRRLSFVEAVRIAIDVCQGLEAAHGFKGASIRMLHRDIKPDNILIDDQSGLARLVDFGIARIVDRTRGLMTCAGTPLYMCPKCADGQASEQSDLYSLGVTIYEMVTGDLPYTNFGQRRQGSPPPMSRLVPEVPGELDALIQSVLDPQPENRPANAAEMLVELRRIRARLQPLPEQYVELSRLPSGQILCDDTESGERVVVRLVHTTASLEELTHQCYSLESRKFGGVLLPGRHCRNEQYIGIVSRPSRLKTLAESFPAPPLVQIDDLRRLCELSALACDVLSNVHRLGLVHGFLSPHAIALDGDAVSIFEFGGESILRARHFAGHSTDAVFGWSELLPYCSPQILAASSLPCTADDVYSLGAVLFHLTTGVAPIDESTRSSLLAGQSPPEESPRVRNVNPFVPRSLAAVLAKALCWNPLDRYATASDLGAALRLCRWPDDVVESLIVDALENYVEGGSPGDFLKACSTLDAALAISPGAVDVHRAKGVLFFRNRSYRFAIEELEKVARGFPTAEVFHYLGQSYAAWNRQLDKATAMFRQSITLEETPSAYDHLARTLWDSGDSAAAVDAMQRAVTLEPDESLRQRRQHCLNDWLSDSGRRKSLCAGIAETSEPSTSS